MEKMRQYAFHNLTLPTMTLMNDIERQLLKQYEGKVYKNKTYLMAEGDLPIMLLAHLDTVWNHGRTIPDPIYEDKTNHILMAPYTGLGADDRAGVAIIRRILDERAYNKASLPSVVFTTGEEMGGVGSMTLLRDFPNPPMELKCMIQLDRCGYNDCVFYECANSALMNKIESYGYSYEEGSFSDICIIAPAWDVGAVNLSVGFYMEHTLGEFLDLFDLNNTYEKVSKILLDATEWEYYDFQHADPSFSAMKPNFF